MPLLDIVLGFLKGIITIVLMIGFFFVTSHLWPVKKKSHPLEWYDKRYQWAMWVSGAAFFSGLAPAFIMYQSGVLSRNDPRGLAVGAFLGITLATVTPLLAVSVSPNHRVRHFLDYLELYHGVRNTVSWVVVLPFYLLSIWGTIHLLLNGPEWGVSPE